MKCIAIAAMTLDGRIALDEHHMSDWTCAEDKAFMRSLLDTCEVVVVGNNTYKTALEPLSKRKCIVFTTSVETCEHRSDLLTYCNPASVDCLSLLQQYERIAVLGGAKTYSWFLKNGLLDELYLTIEPLVFGYGISLFEHVDDEPFSFILLDTKQLNDAGSMLLHYKIGQK